MKNIKYYSRVSDVSKTNKIHYRFSEWNDAPATPVNKYSEFSHESY